MSSIPMLENKIKRLQDEIKRLEDQRTKEMKKESDAIQKMNNANNTIQRTKNITVMRNKQREIGRENKKIQQAKESQTRLLRDISDRNAKLNKAMTELNKLRQKEQIKFFKEQEKNLNETKLNQQIAREEFIATATLNVKNTTMKEYDVFISHATDDKSEYVDKLVEALKIADIKVWYDSESIGWGKSVRQEIDKGLAHSKYGIVIISPSFLKKHWTNYELDGILSKEGNTGSHVLLPIWHNITADEVNKYSSSYNGPKILDSKKGYVKVGL